jgi:rhomboid protease GluP
LLKEVETYNLPPAVHERNKKLIKYCELRVKSYKVLYKAIKENSEQYKSEIEDYNKQIELALSGLQ